MRGDLVADYRTLLIVCAANAALMLLFSIYAVARVDQTEHYYLPWFYGMLFLWGPILASYSFRELHDKTRNEAYLLLPASAFEKTLARLLRTTIAFFVFLLVFLTVSSAVIEGINWFVFSRRNGLFDASHEAVWAPVGHFLVAVSLYFLGAAWFRKMHYIKTALTLMAIPIALACFAAIIANIVFDAPGTFQFAEPDVNFEGSIYNFYLAHKGVFDALLVALQVVYFVVLPIFCWYVAWLRVKETEVSHGV
jgi:hypothetical protein